MILSSVSAFPSYIPTRVEDNGNVSMVFFEKCKPVDPQHLMNQMGESFDGSRMALDEDSVKRSALQERSLEDDDEDNEDDSDVDGETDVQGFDSGIDDLTASKQKLNNDNLKILKWTGDPKSPAYLDSMKLMRRKRDAHLDYLDEASDNSHLTFYHKLMQTNFNRRNKRSQSAKNKKFRKKNRLPWSCKMNKIWLRMEKGYFPEFIRSGKCKSKKCYYSLKDCIPKKYTIKVLRRDPNRCNPVPTVGVNTTYEEAWAFERQHVTVWCECENPRSKKRRRKNRWKSRP